MKSPVAAISLSLGLAGALVPSLHAADKPDISIVRPTITLPGLATPDR